MNRLRVDWGLLGSARVPDGIRAVGDCLADAQKWGYRPVSAAVPR